MSTCTTCVPRYLLHFIEPTPVVSMAEPPAAPEFMGASSGAGGVRAQAHISAVSGAHGWDTLGKISLRRIDVPMAPEQATILGNVIVDGVNVKRDSKGERPRRNGESGQQKASARNDLAHYDVDQYAMAVAPYGGMIALVPKRHAVTSSVLSNADGDLASNVGSHIHIFSGAGVECGRGQFPLKGELVSGESSVFWTEQDKLCCVLVDGALLSYNVHGIGPQVMRVLPEFGGDTVCMARPVRNRGEEYSDDGTPDGGFYFGSNDDSSPSSQSQLCPDHGYTGVVALTKHGRLVYVEDVALGNEEGNITDLGGREAASGPLPTDDSILDTELTVNGGITKGTDMDISNATSRVARGYFADSGSRRVLTLAVCSSEQSTNGDIEVLVSMSNSTILRVSRHEIKDHHMQAQLADGKGNSGPVMRIAVAPNGRFIACYTSGGRLKVFNASSLDKALLDFDTKSAAEPRQMVWAGVDAVVLHWRRFGLLAVGPFGHWIHYSYDVPLQLTQEIDACRIVTSTTCEILQRVPDVTLKTFEMGSTESSALLFAAMQAFHNQEAKADEDIRSIVNSNQLGEAMRDLLDAARAEWDVNGRRGQKRLLAAVSYGSGFHIDARQIAGGNAYNLDDKTGAGVGGGNEAGGESSDSNAEAAPSSNPFVSQSQMLSLACRQLRVLNILRSPHVGLPMTFGMFEDFGAKRVVDRLVDRHMHRLAVKICAYLHLDPRPVMIHWACAKVVSVRQEEMNDVMLHRVIIGKLGTHKNVSYRKVAQTAARAGRNQLAALLLDAEPIARVKISTLLDLNQSEEALERAVKSHDSNLIYRAILAIQSDARAREEEILASHPTKKSIDEVWFPKVLKHKEACDLILLSLKTQVDIANRDARGKHRARASDLLSQIFYYLKWYAAAGNFMVNRAYRDKNIGERIKKLGIAVDMYEVGLTSKVTARADKER